MKNFTLSKKMYRKARNNNFVRFAIISLTTLSLFTCTNTNYKEITNPSTKPISTQNNSYIIGAGVADITGEVAENNMFGYAESSQVTAGLQQRLHARAFSIQDPLNKKNLLIVIVETGAIPQALHQEVLQRLQKRWNKRYDEKNVIISATHTHAAPGGISHYFLYALTTMGFQTKTFNALADGIMLAVERAVATESPARIHFGQSLLTNASAQRSRTAFVKNPIEEQKHFPNAIDPNMTVLRFERDQKTFAAISFFAVHPTSLTSKNHLVSGDNKGYAAYLWESLEESNPRDVHPKFIAAFANTNAGDISPNLNLKPGSGPTENEWENYRIIGKRQADAAISTPMTLTIAGNIDYRQKYVDMSRQIVQAKFTPDGQTHKTCPAAYKSAFAAGSSEDGGGGDGLGVYEGKSNPLIAMLGAILFAPSQELIECQGNKEIAITMGTAKPFPWSPEVLPMQVVRLGQLALVALPGEYTIAAGRRIRKSVADELDIPLEHVIFLGYTNAYSGYNTTPEEYDQQDYEGASTHFGPYTVPAWQQNAAQLAKALKDGDDVQNTIYPRDLRRYQMTLRTDVVFDDTPLGKNFGSVVVQPKARYKKGERASAIFWTGHPKNNLRLEGTFLEVQKLEQGKWIPLLDDNDWNTVYEWKRILGATSQAALSWHTNQNTPAGTYRFVHYGDAKAAFSGFVWSFTGVSRPFEVY